MHFVDYAATSFEFYAVKLAVHIAGGSTCLALVLLITQLAAAQNFPSESFSPEHLLRRPAHMTSTCAIPVFMTKQDTRQHRHT